MAQTTKKKEVSSAPPKSKNMTAAELREWYDKHQRHLENFDKASEAVKSLRDVTKTSTKTITTFSKDTLRTYLQNIGSNEKNLRNLSWYMYYRSQTYARYVNFNANMFCLDARSTIPTYDVTKGGDAKKALKSFYDTELMCEKLHLQMEFFNIYLTCFLQDVFYGLGFYDDTGFFVWPVPADYAKITGKYMTGDYAFAIDMTYFRSRQELLEYMPDPLESMYREYQNSNQKWQPVPDEYAMCFKFRAEDYETVLPPVVAMFNSFINLADLEDIQAIADEQQIYKMIWMEMETIGDEPDDWKVDPSLMAEYFNKMVNTAVGDYTTAAIVPGKLNTITFDSDQATDTTKVQNATQTVLNTAGGAEVLNGATINNTVAFNAAMIFNAEYAMSSLLPQTEAWVNRFLTYYVSNPSKVKFLEVSVYTKENMKKSLLEAAQYGLPTKLAYNTLNGYSALDTLSLNFLEEEVLGLHDLLKYPLSSSFTSTGESDEEVGKVGEGRPAQDDTELTDDAEKSREKRAKS